ncbi:MAG: tetratricopeptide repeat protein [Vulcanimicrobiota bacterium]
MPNFDNCQTLRELFESALAALLAELSPERAFIAYKEKGSREFEPRGTHGLEPQSVFTTGEISLEVIKTVVHEGKPVHLVDAIQAPGFSNRTSVILSGLRSILCVPFKHPSGLVVGMIYADNRLKAGAFKDEHLEFAKTLANEVGSRLVALSVKKDEPTASNSGSVDAEAWARARSEGIRLYGQGDLDRAEELLVEALSLAEGFGRNDVRYAKTLSEMAELHRARQRADQAERLLIRSIEIFERNQMHSHPDLAATLNNLAGLYYAAGNGMRAEGLFRRALKIWEETLEAHDKRLAPVHHNLGTLCRDKAASDEAIGHFRRALEIAEKAWGNDDPRTAKCRQSLTQMQ